MSDKKQIVLVRTYSAGVHIGELVERTGREVTLANARRIWSWVGANSLNEIASDGCGTGSRVSVPVEKNTLTEAIEILNVSEAAAAKIAELKWAK